MLDELNKLIDRRIKLVIDKAVVQSVAETTCKVKSLTNDKIYFKCSLNAVVDNDDQELKITPAIGSVVLIAILDEQATIIQVSKISRLKLKIENTTLEAAASGVKIERNGKNLKQKLNTQTDEFLNLCDVVKNIVVNVDSGVGPNVPAVELIKNNVEQNNNDINEILV